VLVDAARERVTGIIDFGDCVHTCLVFELAICIAYMLLGKDDVQAVARHIYKGYAARIPLTPDEKALLHCLIAARLAQSVTMGLAPRPAPRAPRPAPRGGRRGGPAAGAYSHSKDPTNDYLLVTAKTGQQLYKPRAPPLRRVAAGREALRRGPERGAGRRQAGTRWSGSARSPRLSSRPRSTRPEPRWGEGRWAAGLRALGRGALGQARSGGKWYRDHFCSLGNFCSLGKEATRVPVE
jgi:hypothetical protein